MRKIRIILALVICGGVFLCGVGAGISFLDFSSFTYVGEKELGGSDIQTTTLDCAIDPMDKETLRLSSRYLSGTTEQSITEDQTVPVNTVRFKVKYNAETIEPFVQESDGYIYLEYFSVRNDFKTFMVNKDLFLEGIKNREFAAYKTTGLERVEVFVNPETKDRLKVE